MNGILVAVNVENLQCFVEYPAREKELTRCPTWGTLGKLQMELRLSGHTEMRTFGEEELLVVQMLNGPAKGRFAKVDDLGVRKHYPDKPQDQSPKGLIL